MNTTTRRYNATTVYWAFMAVAWSMLAFLAGIIYALLVALDTPAGGIAPTEGSQPVVAPKESLHGPLQVQASVDVDHWRITQAIRAWNQAGADLTLVDECDTTQPTCVEVVQAYEPTEDWAGRHYTWQGRIVLNAAYDQTPMERQMIACHELGHAIGAEHQAGTCMAPVVSSNTTPPPLP